MKNQSLVRKLELSIDGYYVLNGESECGKVCVFKWWLYELLNDKRLELSMKVGAFKFW